MNTTGHREFPSTSRLPRKHGCWFWVSRGILGVFIAIGALLISGMMYENVAASGDVEHFPSPGQIVQVENHGMHLNCIGEGDVTVVFEAGFGAWSEAWIRVQPRVGAFTRACSYDRAGMGWSDVSQNPQTPEQIAHDLHGLLTAAGIPAPYILVGHSMGGKSIRLFVSLYPDSVAGLVFVDARHESLEPIGRTPAQQQVDRDAYESSLNLYRTLRQMGVARLFGLPLGRAVDPSLKHYPDESAYRLVLFSTRETTLQTMMAESEFSTANDEQLRTAILPESLPIIVLTADSSLNSAGWEDGQKNLAALSSNSLWQIVSESDHNIHAEHPEAVTTAIRLLWDSIQSGHVLGDQQ